MPRLVSILRLRFLLAWGHPLALRSNTGHDNKKKYLVVSVSCDVRPRDTLPDTTQIELAEEEEQKVSLNNTSATTGGEMGCWLGKIMWYLALFT